jgi:hypothetical protein
MAGTKNGEKWTPYELAQWERRARQRHNATKVSTFLDAHVL